MKKTRMTKLAKRIVRDVLIGFAMWMLAFQSVGYAQERRKDNLTVEQAVNVYNGLVALGSYKFDGDVLMLVAINIDMGRRIKTQFESANNTLIASMSSGGSKVEDEKMGAYLIEARKILDAPSRVEFHHLKKKDLRLDDNQIPAPILSLIVPIIDR